MVVNQLSSRKKLRTNSNNLQNSVGINCQYVWLKHNIASQITNSYLEHQKVLIITIREFVPKTGAGFIVALTGDVMTMPGLPKAPAALKMDVAEDGTAVGLF